MPREARVVAVGVPHHSTKRGNNRQYIFVAGEDRRQYLVALAQDSARCRIGLLGWCLMTHHVHLAGVPERPDAFARGLQRCHSRWAQRFHRQYPRSGHLWQGRFFSCALDRDHLRTARAYADLHPVRAGRGEMRRRISGRALLRTRKVEIARACWTWKNPEEPWGGQKPATNAGRTWVGVRWPSRVVARFVGQLMRACLLERKRL